MEKLGRYFVKAVGVIGLVISGIAVYYAANYLRETVYIGKYTNEKTLILLVWTFLLGTFFSLCIKKIDRLSTAKLKIIFAVLGLAMVIVQLYLAVKVPVSFTSDHYRTHESAYAIASGLQTEIDTVNDDYWSMFGNMYFYAGFLTGFYKLLLFLGIKNVALCSIVLNIICLDIGVLYTALIAKEIRGIKFAFKALLFCMLNPMLYLMIHWFYTSTISILFLMGGIYYGIKFYKKPGILYGVCGTVFWIIGGNFRPTTYIGLIALGVSWILYNMQKKTEKRNGKGNSYQLKKYLTIVVICVFTAVLLNSGCKWLSGTVAKDTSKNFPISHWLMIGVQGNGRVTVEAQEYTRSFETKEDKVRGNIEEIKKQVRQKGLSGMLELAFEKISYTWADGTNYYYYRAKQEVGERIPIYKYLYGEKRDLIVWYCQAYRILCLLMIGIYFIHVITGKQRMEFILGLTLVGAFLFYLMWESKVDYNLQFLWLMSLIACIGFEGFGKIKCNVPQNEKKLIYRALFGVVILLTCFAFILQSSNYTEKKNVFRDYAVQYVNDTFMYWYFPTVDNSFKQEFVTSQPFSEIAFQVIVDEQADAGDAYRIEIVDGSGKMLVSENVDDSFVKDGELVLSFDTIIPENEQKYTIIVTKLVETNKLYFKVKYKQTPVLEDTCVVLNGVADSKQAMMFSVCLKEKKPYVAKSIYWITFLGFIIAEIVLMKVGNCKYEGNAYE